MPNAIKVTSDYDKFSFIKANRDQSRGHIETLKKAFEEIGNLTKVQPILVNDRFQIVDGQHRFTAIKELGEPVYYTKVSGLGVNEARSMNLLHRTWRVDDFAKSYALSGDKNYQKYIQLKEDYGFSHTVILLYISNRLDNTGTLQEFREGNFVIEDEDGAVDRLEYLSKAAEAAPIVSYRPVALAMLKLMQIEGFDRDRMLTKLEKYGHKIERVDNVESNMRQLEDVYNQNVALSNRTRLY